MGEPVDSAKHGANSRLDVPDNTTDSSEAPPALAAAVAAVRDLEHAMAVLVAI